MKILLLYKYSNHRHLLSDMMDDMSKRDLEIAALDVVHFTYHGSYLPKKRLIAFIRLLLKIPKFRGLMLMLFRNQWISFLSKKFDIIDIHAFSSDYQKLLGILKRNKKHISVTYWGSDLFRATKKEREKQINLLHNVDLVRTTSPQAYRIVNNFGLDVPITMCRFGVGNLELLMKRRHESKEELYQPLKNILPQGILSKTLVVIGNNGNKMQQHLKIIRELSKLDDKLRDVFFIIHASYSLEDYYKTEIIELIQSFTEKYYVIDEFLTREQLNSLILLTDIYVSAQKTDAFSAFVQEHLAAGTIVMAGEWLPYFLLRDESIYIIDFKIDTLAKKFSNVVKNLPTKKYKSRKQNGKMFELSSWSTLGLNWYNSYQILKLSTDKWN